MLLASASAALSAWVMRDVINAAFVIQDLDLLLPLVIVSFAICSVSTIIKRVRRVTEHVSKIYANLCQSLASVLRDHASAQA